MTKKNLNTQSCQDWQEGPQIIKAPKIATKRKVSKMAKSSKSPQNTKCPKLHTIAHNCNHGHKRPKTHKIITNASNCLKHPKLPYLSRFGKYVHKELESYQQFGYNSCNLSLLLAKLQGAQQSFMGLGKALTGLIQQSFIGLGKAQKRVTHGAYQMTFQMFRSG